jgi:hypothetical protein
MEVRDARFRNQDTATAEHPVASIPDKKELK